MAGEIPGAPVVPSHFGESMILYTEAEEVGAVVDGAPPGPLGRLFVVPVGKATRVPHEAGRFILDHLGYTGVVRVEVTESDTGTKYNIAKAKQESMDKLKLADEMRFKQWLTGVIEDYVKRSKPVPEPDEGMMKVIQRRGYDLKQYGIVPIGWAEKGANAELQQLKDQVALLTAALAAKAPTPLTPAS